jgi:hypothetical protein
MLTSSLKGLISVAVADFLSLKALRALSEYRRHPSVSIYCPTHAAGDEKQQDRIRFKNLLKQAEGQLRKMEIRMQETHELLQPASELLKDVRFWLHQSDGLAVFIGPQFFHTYRLPSSFEELVVTTERFHIKPLLPLFSGEGRFYIFALSQNELRLFEGRRNRVHEVELEAVPESLAEALRYDVPERTLQFHTQTPQRGGGRRAAIFHGQGVGTDDSWHKKDILRFFQQVDRGIHDLLAFHRSPLVLAGVDFVQSIYREANSYPHLMEKGIAGNPEQMSSEELYKEAWPIVQPLFEADRRSAIERYHARLGTGLTSKAVPEIIHAAQVGRVETLFVALGIQIWGVVDAAENVVSVHEVMAVGDEDLLDAAAVQTLTHGGTVYAFSREDMPDDALVAAVFRY